MGELGQGGILALGRGGGQRLPQDAQAAGDGKGSTKKKAYWGSFEFMKPTPGINEPSRGGLIAGEQFLIHAEFPDQIQGPGFAVEKTVGACLNDIAVI